MTDFYLYDHPNPNGRFYYPTRRTCRHGYTSPHLIVLHSAENLPDFDPPDMGAENVARYASRTQRQVSWHSTIDSDSIIPMLPFTATAWHVQGFNSCSVGFEIATQHDAWLRSPEPWLHRVYDNVGDELARARDELGIPLVDVRDDPAGRGVTTHAVLDPTRRKDPGEAFPFQWIVWMAAHDWRYSGVGVPSPASPPPPTPPTPRPLEPVSLMGPPTVTIRQMQDWARAEGGTDLFVELAAPCYRYAQAHGEDPAVPYGIMRHESDAGKFTGLLDVSFRNWGGIKRPGRWADDDREGHQRFPTHDEGVRAVVQHVAGYAGLMLPAGELVDPRFAQVRGKRIDAIPHDDWSWASTTHDTNVVRHVYEMRAA